MSSMSVLRNTLKRTPLSSTFYACLLNCEIFSQLSFFHISAQVFTASGHFSGSVLLRVRADENQWSTLPPAFVEGSNLQDGVTRIVNHSLTSRFWFSVFLFQFSVSVQYPSFLYVRVSGIMKVRLCGGALINSACDQTSQKYIKMVLTLFQNPL